MKGYTKIVFACMLLVGVSQLAAVSDEDENAVSSDIFNCYEGIHPDYLKVDVPPLIHIHDANDAHRIRDNIINYLWKADGWPGDKQPANITSEAPKWMAEIGSSNIDRVERLDILMDYDMHSYAYLFHPQKSVNRLLIFHMGHSDYILRYGGKEIIKRFLDHGYSIITFWMPLTGENSRIAYNVPGHGRVNFKEGGTSGHNKMSTVLDNADVSFIRFFIEPVVVANNYVKLKYHYRDINMVGISGGGWATHVCAAIDPRISYSFPVAGSLPLYLRFGPCANGSEGDAEQYHPGLYEEIASWLDIYILGSYGNNRRQVHILNQYDECCFGGINYMTFESNVADAVQKLGPGSYNVYLDSSHMAHKISSKATDEVIYPLIKSRLPLEN